MTKKLSLSLALAIIATAAYAQQNKSTDKDAAYWAKALASRIKISGYAQGGYSVSLPEHGTNSNTFEVRRVQVAADADITPQFHARVQYNFKGNKLQEYYLDYKPSKAFNVRLGQFKRQFSIENPLSPTTVEGITGMSEAVKWYNGGDPLVNESTARDAGLMLYGKVAGGQLGYYLSVLNGGQINTSDKDNKKNIILKLEYRPVDQLLISASGETGYGYAVADSKYNWSVQKGESFKQERYSVGAEYKSKGKKGDYYRNRSTLVRSELLGSRDGKVHSLGAYITSAIPVSKGFDIIAQADYINLDTDQGLKKTVLTAGLQYWFYNKCRFQAQYKYTGKNSNLEALDGTPSGSQIITQVQVAF